MDKLKYLINMSIAYILYPFKKNSFKNRRIWIVGGNAGELYVDNGRAMYEYLRAKEEIEEHWVINKNSKVAKKIPGKKLIKGSIQSYLYFMNAEVVLFSHSISADIVPYLFVVPFLKRFHKKVFKVFLNHGTVGFKVNHPMNKKTQKIAQDIVKSYDLNICDSNFEKNIKTKVWWKVPENTAVVTGYPRYDKLYNVKSSQKEILFMPTWRNWIKTEHLNIEETNYFKNITNLITNSELNDFLDKKNIKFNIYIHQLMQNYLKNFDSIKLSKNVKILPIDAEITQELRGADLLITDYSSVAYDFYYLNKPIIFFQFDKDKYDRKVGSYVKNKDLFGIQVKNVEKCVENVIKISENNFNYDKNLKEKFEKLQPKFLKYTDKKNCDRVYTEIIKHLKNK